MLYILVLLCHLDAGLEQASECDEIEVNHYYDEQACLCFTQLIGWNYYSQGKHCAWYIMHPHAMYERNGYWHYNYYPQSELHVVRLRSKVRTETWTQWDPECHDRENVDPRQRAGPSLLRGGGR